MCYFDLARFEGEELKRQSFRERTVRRRESGDMPPGPRTGKGERAQNGASRQREDRSCSELWEPGLGHIPRDANSRGLWPGLDFSA